MVGMLECPRSINRALELKCHSFNPVLHPHYLARLTIINVEAK